MKFKKAFAVILAVAMVITLMPSMAFAATTNTVTEVLSVEADDTMPIVQLNLKASGNDAVGGIFDITLNNAEFDLEDQDLNASAISGTTTPSSANIDLKKANGKAIAIAEQATAGAIATANSSATIVTIDSTSARIDTRTTISEDAYYIVLLRLKSGTEEGDVTVTVNNVNAKVSNGTYTVATVGTSGTVTTVVGSTIKKVSSDSVSQLANQIKISETSVNAVDEEDNEYQAIKLTLPKYYSWNDNTIIGGDMLNGSSTTLGGIETAGHLLSSTVTMSAVTGDLASASRSSNIYAELTNDDRSLTIFFDSKAQGHQEVLTITPYLDVDADASEGEVKVSVTNVKGDITGASGLVIANNVAEGVEVKTFSEITTVQSGLKYENGESASQTPYYVYVQLKENIETALTNARTVTFDFPEEVQVVDKPAYIVGSGTTRTSSYTNTNGVKIKETTEKDASEFTWSTSANNNLKETITFKVPVSVEAGFEGDIDVTVSGSKAGIEEQTITVGKAVNPVTIETESTDVKTGIQKQPVADIIITETAKGMLQKDASVRLTIKDAEVTFNAGDYEVTSGDLEITSFTKKENYVEFKIKSESTEASTIKITGLKISLDRTLAEGGYNLRAAGSALVDNAAYDGEDFSSYSVQVADYIKVVTPADSVTVSEKVDAKFVIGEASYTNNGEATEMDAAAYIDSHNRTMVPIRYVANACGISENDIRWDQNTQTAIINGLNTVVTVKMGSNKLQTSTGEITMDTVAVNNNGRIYVPVRYIANALGANVSWDAATKTVTLTK